MTLSLNPKALTALAVVLGLSAGLALGWRTAAAITVEDSAGNPDVAVPLADPDDGSDSPNGGFSITSPNSDGDSSSGGFQINLGVPSSGTSSDGGQSQ